MIELFEMLELVEVLQGRVGPEYHEDLEKIKREIEGRIADIEAYEATVEEELA